MGEKIVVNTEQIRNTTQSDEANDFGAFNPAAAEAAKAEKLAEMSKDSKESEKSVEKAFESFDEKNQELAKYVQEFDDLTRDPKASQEQINMLGEKIAKLSESAKDDNKIVGNADFDKFVDEHPIDEVINKGEA
jgi:septal ring factor EnvC (AmiA/AmiB activator)